MRKKVKKSRRDLFVRIGGWFFAAILMLAWAAVAVALLARLTKP